MALRICSECKRESGQGDKGTETHTRCPKCECEYAIKNLITADEPYADFVRFVANGLLEDFKEYGIGGWRGEEKAYSDEVEELHREVIEIISSKLEEEKKNDGSRR